MSETTKSATVATANPFVDPVSEQRTARLEEAEALATATLAIGRDASLTLGNDSLIVLGMFL
jgi:hypothetical protein